MLSDEDFYAAIQPHLLAKRAGQAQKITPKDASATQSNGGKAAEGVTESVGPNGPKLSIIVRSGGSSVPAGQRLNTVRYNSNRTRSSEHTGRAWPVVETDPNSIVDGYISLDNGAQDKVKITEAKHYHRPNYDRKSFGDAMMDTVAFALQSVNVPTVSYIITFDGHGTIDGEFRTIKPELNDLAGDWMVRYMVRQKNGR